ncbi:MAG: L,D-transpeptidase [Candidatus Poribacteria bacterium]
MKNRCFMFFKSKIDLNTRLNSFSSSISFLRKQESKGKLIIFSKFFFFLLLSFLIFISIATVSNSDNSEGSKIDKKNNDRPKVSKIVVTKSKFTLEVYNDKNEIIKTYKVAIGKNPGDKQRKGDMRTPIGEFKIIQIQNSKSWVYDFPDDDLGPIKGAYGPWFIRLKTPKWTGIGIHGTHDPKSIGTMSSTGCIRMRNEDIAELKNMVKIGIPVVIRE